MNATIHALDRDSSAGYTDTIQFHDEDSFKEAVKEFEKDIPFTRYYFDIESDTPGIEDWL